MEIGKTISTKTKTITLIVKPSYYEALAWALGIFAVINKEFHTYVKRTNKFWPQNSPDNFCQPNVNFLSLLPFSTDDAESKFNWLRDMDASGSIEANKALRIIHFSVSANTNKLVKPLIIGIVGIAIIGPTLGLVNKKKIMNILIEKNFRQKFPGLIPAKTIQTSHGIIADALKRARGKLRKIDPITLDWFLGKREIKLFETDLADLRITTDEMRSAHIPHKINNHHEKPVVLALSPEVNIDYLNKRWREIEF